MSEIKKQIHRLLALSGLGSFQLAGASWVALLAARGFSLVEIGLAESCFHCASLLFEIPSGIIADVFGRKKSVVLSQVMFILSALCMAFSTSLTEVCIALALDAWGYNFASGAREALAYDSMKAAGQEGAYMEFSSRELAIYRIGNAAAILCAGLALQIGHFFAYLTDALLGFICLGLACSLREAQVQQKDQPEGGVAWRVLRVLSQSLGFIIHGGRTMALMLVNSLVGAAAVLTVFFLQARLPQAGLDGALLGPALFAISLGGVFGARLATRFANHSFGATAVLCLSGTVFGALCGMGSSAVLMCMGGFTASLCSDLLEIRADAALNARFPSAQRSTLLSVASLVFSLVMMVLSPLAGFLFE